MKTDHLVWRVSIMEAASWELHKTTLQWELIDLAEEKLGVKSLAGDINITINGDCFECVFVPSAE